MVRVLYYASVRERVGAFETRLEDFSGTVAELVAVLRDRCGVTLLPPEEEADPLDVLIVMVNGRHIAHIGGPAAPVRDGDLVTIFPVVAGG